MNGTESMVFTHPMWQLHLFSISLFCLGGFCDLFGLHDLHDHHTKDDLKLILLPVALACSQGEGRGRIN